MKPGYKTSEFYMAVMGVVALVMREVQMRCQFDMAFVASVAGVVMTYVAGRTYLKSKNEK